jgi:hypothetical protein
VDMDGTQLRQTEICQAKVSGINIEWHPQKGTCTFDRLPVAMMWLDPNIQYIQKPFSVQSLASKVRESLDE